MLLQPGALAALERAIEHGATHDAAAPIAEVMRHAGHCHDCWAAHVYLTATSTHRAAHAAAGFGGHYVSHLEGASDTTADRWVLDPNQRLWQATYRAIEPWIVGHPRVTRTPLVYSIAQLSGWRRSLDDLEASTALLFVIRYAAEIHARAAHAATHAAEQILHTQP